MTSKCQVFHNYFIIFLYIFFYYQHTLIKLASLQYLAILTYHYFTFSITDDKKGLNIFSCDR